MIPYPLPKLHNKIFKKEVERLVLLGVPDRENDSELGAPYLTQLKHKSNKVCFLSDFKNLNKQLNHKPYPMPKNDEMIFKLGSF